MFGLLSWVLQFIVVALIIRQGLLLLAKKREANRRKNEFKKLQRLAETEPASISEQSLAKEDGHRSTAQACSLCGKLCTARCSRCKVARYCSGKCQIIHWRYGHENECVKTKMTTNDRVIRPTGETPKLVNEHGKESYSDEADQPRNDKQPSTPDEINCDWLAFTRKEFSLFLGSSSALCLAWLADAKEGTTNPKPLIESSEEATKKAPEQNEERVRYLEEELAKSKNEILLLKSECSKWSTRTSFASRRLNSLMREYDEKQIAEEARVVERSKQDKHIRMLESECAKVRKELLEEQERVRWLQLEVEITRNSMREVEETRVAERRKQEKYIQMLHDGWLKAIRELEEEEEFVQLLKLECEEIRQSSMRQMEKKELELANALNAAAAAEAELSHLEKEINSSDDKACAICLTNENDMAFGCGHMTCGDCGLAISMCPICREPITSRLRLFPG